MRAAVIILTAIVNAMLGAIASLFIAQPNQLPFVYITFGFVTLGLLALGIMEKSYFEVRRENRDMARRWLRLSDELFAQLQAAPDTASRFLETQRSDLPAELREREWERARENLIRDSGAHRSRIERVLATRLEAARIEMENANLTDKDAPHTFSGWSVNPLSTAAAARYVGARALVFYRANGGKDELHDL